MPFLHSLCQHAISLLGAMASPLRANAQPFARWEWGVVAGLVVLSLGLGLPNLAGPSLWHDELVHIYVAKSIAETGWPALPSGNFYPSSTAYNVLLALFVKCFGDGAVAVRLPSVLLGGLNTALLYGICRIWLGRSIAIWAAFFFATSPWQVGWARQARLYEFQITSYLLTLWCSARFLAGAGPRATMGYGLGAVAAYLTGLMTSFHSILYLGPPGAMALLALAQSKKLWSRAGGVVAACTVLGLATIAFFYLNPNPVDRAAVFETGLGGRLLDQLRTDRYYYFRFLGSNLSMGFFLLALLGSGILLTRRDPRGVWVVAGFWIPVLILTFLVGYRRHRFMFFAYPLYIVLFSVGLAGLIAALRLYRNSLVHGMAALLIVLFLVRLGLSEAKLLADSLEAARGADTTLATHHPRWREPAEWVKARRKDETILATTWLPAHYYIGHVDNWFPNRYTKWEYQESGLEGLGSLEELKAFLAEHPVGYFLAESSRFMMWRYHGDLVQDLGREVSWVETYMEFIPEASSEDVYVWRWDFRNGDDVVVP